MSVSVNTSTIGTAPYTYRLEADWAKLPEGWVLKDVAAVGVDADDRVYVFNRGNHPMIVFDRDGNVLDTWGEKLFKRPHGMHIAPDGLLYLTDDGDHTVRKCTPSGKVLLEIGVPGRPAPKMSGEPFNRCTHTALSPQQDIYVSDGYGNAAVHKYTPDGKHVKSWGGCGTDPGQFALPHNIACDEEGWVYVADRENHRVQIFDTDGKYETQWNNMARLCGLYMAAGRDPLCYIGELGPGMKHILDFPNLGPRISITTNKGEVVARLGALHAGTQPGAFVAPHGIAVDSHGDIYVAQVAHTYWPTAFPETPIPSNVPTIVKLEKARP